MEFPFKSDREKRAITALDEDIYPDLPIINEARYYDTRNWPRNISCGDIRVSTITYNDRPNAQQLSFNHLVAFHEALGPLEGHWSVILYTETAKAAETVHDDGFRSVMSYGPTGIELVIRTVNDDHGTHRLFIGPGDAQDCVQTAMDEVKNAATSNSNPHAKLVQVIGVGSLSNPHYDPRTVYRPPGNDAISFEWKIRHKLEHHDIAKRVQKWRLDVCGGARAYNSLEKEYLKFIFDNEIDDPRGATRKMRRQLPPLKTKTAKRSVDEVAVGEEFDPTGKRRSKVAHVSSRSQSESAPLSNVSSPEILGRPSLAGAIMDPLSHRGPTQPRANIERPIRQPRRITGSREGFGADSSHIASTMADLRVQSPILSSSGDSPPRHEGSSWDGPEGRAEWTPREFGEGFTPWYSAPGYQGPGQVEQSPSYGQPTEVYGHLRYDFQGPSQKMQQSTQYGRRNAPPAGQKSRPWWGVDEQAPAQSSSQVGPPMEFAQPHPGSGYAGQSGPNVPVSIPQQPQYLTAAQFGGGNISPNFPPDAPPMSHPEDMPSLPPPATRDINPTRLETPTTLALGGENYPYSVPPATQFMPASMIHRPEDEFLSADSGLYSEPESDGEGQPAYSNAPVSQTLQYPGDQDDDRYSRSPSPTREDQAGYEGPVWFENEFEAKDSDDY